MSFLSNIKKVFGFEAESEEFNDMSDGEDIPFVWNLRAHFL